LGYSVSTTNSTNKTTSPTAINVMSMTLDIGGWLITIRGFFNTPASNFEYLAIGISTTSATFNNSYRTTYTPFSGFGTDDFYFNNMFYFSNNTSRTLYFIATSQNNGTINSGADMIAVRLH
jgi:hypothetical protein